MRAHFDPVAIVRALAVSSVLVVGLLGAVAVASAEVVNPVFNPHQCLNWGVFGVFQYTDWEVIKAPSPDTISRYPDPGFWLAGDGGYDGAIEVPANVIRANDDGDDTSRILLYAPPEHASFFDLREDGSFTYKPDDGYYGADTFQYLWERTGFCSQPTTVTIEALTQAHLFDDDYTVDAFPPPVGPNGEIPVDTWPTPPVFSGGRTCVAPGQCGVLNNDQNLGPDSNNNLSWDALSFSQGVRTQHGWLKRYINGAFDYRPDAGFEGEDWVDYNSFPSVGLHDYSIRGRSEARATFHVRRSSAGDVQPNDDNVSTVEDTPVGIAPADLIANDVQTFTIGSVQGIDTNFSRPPTVRTAHGSLSINWFQVSPFVFTVNGLVYTPDANYAGPDSFSYLGRGETTTGVAEADLATVFIDVTPTDDPPTAVDDTAFTRAGTPITIDVAANDTDPDGDLVPSSVRLLTANSRWNVNPDGTITYSLEDGLWGGNSNAYEIADARGVVSTASVTVRVSPLIDDAYTTAEDGTLVVDAAAGVRANDAVAVGATPTVELVSGPTYGTLTLDPSGAFTYVPDADYDWQDSFTYRTIGGPNTYSVSGETATVSIRMTPVPDAPVVTLNSRCAAAADLPSLCTDGLDRRNVFEGQAVRLRGRIDDPDHPATGSFTVDWGDGSPLETYAYPCMNLPVNPTACQSDVWYEPTSTWFGGDPASGRVFFDLSHVYADDPATGPDDYTITVTPIDGQPSGAAEAVTTAASVSNVAPTMVLAPDCGPGAGCFGFASFLTVDLGSEITLLGRLQDPGTDPVQLSVNWGDGVGGLYVQDCADGTACPTTSGQTSCTATLFLPASCGFFRLHHTYATAGDHQIIITAFDGDNGLTAPQFATAHILVSDVAPVAGDDAFDVDEDGQLVVAAADSVLANDTDADAGDTLTATLLTNPAKGEVSAFAADGTFTYTPDANASGDDSFTYKACDAQAECDSATVTIHVASLPDAPVAGDDNGGTVAEDGTLTVQGPGVLANDTDADGDALVAESFSDPAHGNVTGSADGSFTYTPDPNANGTDTFSYEACDPTNRCDTATVTITITPVNDSPVARDDAYEVADGVLLSVNAPGLLANDSDVDGDPLTIGFFDYGHMVGQHLMNPDGSFTYQSAPGFGGTETFSYRVSDGHGGSASANVRIVVTVSAHAPQAVDDGYNATEDQALTVSAADGVLHNDSDLNGDPITAALLGGPTKGSVTLSPNGSFVYTPHANANGDDSFTYKASDGGLTSGAATVTIHIAAVNDRPTAGNDAYSTTEDQALTISAANGLFGNDADVDGDTLTAVLVSGVGHGTLTLHANGSFTYTPAANYFGADSFTYKASDGTLQSTTATVSLTVTSVNDLPTIQVVDGSCQSDADPIGTIVVQVSDVETALTALSLSATSSATKIVPANGLSFTGSGGVRTLMVTGSAKQSGTTVVTVRVTDGNGGTAVVPINVIIGTAKAETISGVVGTDLIFGLADRDTISGGPAGDTSIDVLCGGSGDDTLRGGAGNDVLVGASGSDTLEGGAGNDALWGGSGADVLRGEAGNDTLRGESGPDQFSGGDGSDTYVDLKASEGDTAIDPAP